MTENFRSLHKEEEEEIEIKSFLFPIYFRLLDSHETPFSLPFRARVTDRDLAHMP